MKLDSSNGILFKDIRLFIDYFEGGIKHSNMKEEKQITLLDFRS